MSLTVETVTANIYLLTNDDDGKLLLFTPTNGLAVTITCPDTLLEGKEIVCVQAGTGQLTFVTSGTATFLNSATPQSREERAYIAVTLESDGTYAFNGAMGSDKVLVKSNYAASGVPAVTNDDTEGYAIGSRWIFGNLSYICTDTATGAAVWVPIGNMFSDGSVAMTGSLDMGTNTIDNVVDPTTAQQAATKAYVDANTGVGNGDIKADGTVPFTADQSMGTNKLTNVVDPTSNQDAATKKYVDDQISGGGGGFVLADGSVAFTGEQSMGTNKLTNVVDPTLAQDAATKAYVDSNPNSAVLDDGSVPMTAALAMGSNKITGLGAPTTGQDASNKTYVDNAVANSGHIKQDGTVAFTGPQSMGANKLTNLSPPTTDLDAANKAYVDGAIDAGGNIKANGTVAFFGNQSMGNNKLTNVTDPTAAQDAATKAYVDANAGGGGSVRKPQEFLFKFQGSASYAFDKNTTIVSKNYYSFTDFEDGTHDYFHSSSNTTLAAAIASFIANMNNQGQTRTRLEIKAHRVNNSSSGTAVQGEADYMFDWENGRLIGEGTYRIGLGSQNSQSCEMFPQNSSWTPTSTSHSGESLWNYGYATNIGTSSLGLYAGSMYIVPSTRSFVDGSGNTNDVHLVNFTEFNGSSVTTREMSYTYKFTNYFD